jgi:hypothetical protein
MTKKANCKACTNIRFGVKTRKSVPHTCGKSSDQIRQDMEKKKYWDLCKDRKPDDTGNSLHVLQKTYYIDGKTVICYWDISGDSDEPDLIEIKD